MVIKVVQFHQTVVRLMAICVVGLSACASPPYLDDPNVQAASKTSDLQEIFRRWGILTTMLDSSWATGYSGAGSSGYVRTASWMVEGSAMRVEQFQCMGTTCRRNDFFLFYDQKTNSIALHCDWGPNGVDAPKVNCVSPTVRAQALEDGSLKVVYAAYSILNQQDLTGFPNLGVLRYDPRTRTVSNSWLVLDRKKGEETKAQWRQLAREGQRLSDQESRAFWENALGAVQGAAQAYSIERQNAAPVFTPGQSTGRPTGAPAAAQQLPTQRAKDVPMQRPQPASKIAPAPQSRSVPAQVVAAAPPAALKPEGPTRSAYPEAVVVCTIPSGELGRFTCANPVNQISGHVQINPSEWRTPESMIRSFSGSCRDARPLRSTTHLVWGCGFAATGLTGYLDRSAGVHIDGRQTYYCVERQQGCRRTSP